MSDLGASPLGFANIEPMRGRFDGAITLDKLGCFGDGLFDNAAALAALPTGVPIIGKAGTYRINSPWLLKSGQVIWLQQGFRLSGGFVTTGSSGMITQADITTPLSNLELYGGTFGKTSNTIAGRIFCLNANDSKIENFLIDTFGGDNVSGGGAMFLVGDRLKVGFGRAINPAQNAGCAGIRYLGGTGARFYCLNFNSGDDTFQCTPGATGTNSNLDIADCQYSQCNGISYAARLIVAAQVNQGQSGGLSCSIQCSFDQIRGTANQRAIIADNQDSSGALNIVVTNCDIAVTDPTLSPIFIRGAIGQQTIGSMAGIVRDSNHAISRSGSVSVDTTGISFA